ncbi:MAG TPA: hypothetical protein VD962_08750 [Rubricoccaceae bacterium]|nr:hypothetical protein [Rubricoccaceae bacterium]
MRLLLPAFVLLVACAAPDAPASRNESSPSAASATNTTGGFRGASGDFDARAWVRAALEATGGADMEHTNYDDPRVARIKALADTLDRAVGWKRACDSYWDPESNREIYEPEPDGGGHWARGMMELHPFGDDEHVVAVTCNFGAYQGYYALAHLDGDEATLLLAQDYDEHAQPYGPPGGTFSTLRVVDPDTREFTTFGLARGLGDCGEFGRYRVGEDGTVEVVEIRMRGCDPTVPDELPPPEEWPVVYPRQ